MVKAFKTEFVDQPSREENEESGSVESTNEEFDFDDDELHDSGVKFRRLPCIAQLIVHKYSHALSLIP